MKCWESARALPPPTSLSARRCASSDVMANGRRRMTASTESSTGVANGSYEDRERPAVADLRRRRVGNPHEGHRCRRRARRSCQARCERGLMTPGPPSRPTSTAGRPLMHIPLAGASCECGGRSTSDFGIVARLWESKAPAAGPKCGGQQQGLRTRLPWLCGRAKHTLPQHGSLSPLGATRGSSIGPSAGVIARRRKGTSKHNLEVPSAGSLSPVYLFPTVGTASHATDFGGTTQETAPAQRRWALWRPMRN